MAGCTEPLAAGGGPAGGPDLQPRRHAIACIAGTLAAAVMAPVIGATGGCTSWPAPTVPMPVRRISPAGVAADGVGAWPTARCVLLPGALSRAEDFVTEGFVADLQAAAPGCEVLLADAHLGYFVEGQLLTRLRADVVHPDAPGPRPWLIGISLGAFAALAYAMRHGEEIAGVLALAPYLGRRELLRDISAAGGLAGWAQQPARAGEAYETIEEDVWRWLARPGVGAGGTGPAVFLGYGREDRFAAAQQVLQALLPADHTHTAPGGHDWPPWRVLWRHWLQRGLLAPGRAA